MCFSYKYFPNRRGGISGFGQAPATRRAAENQNNQDGRHRWGRGNHLGGDQNSYTAQDYFI